MKPVLDDYEAGVVEDFTDAGERQFWARYYFLCEKVAMETVIGRK